MEGATGEQGVTRASEETPSTGETGGQTKTIRRRRSPNAKRTMPAQRRTRPSIQTPHIGGQNASNNIGNWAQAFAALGNFVATCEQMGQNETQILGEAKTYLANYSVGRRARA